MPPKKRPADSEALDDAPNTGKDWTKFASVCLLSNHPKLDKGCEIKVAGFDMDDTIVKAKDGRTFPKGRTDWEWLHESVPAKLKELHSQGYWIVFMSNQAGLEGDAAKTGQVQGKINDISKALGGIPISAALAIGKDEYRKPEKKLWDLVQKELLHGLTVDYKNSFYIGDAAGRSILTMAHRKKDFSCGDRKFAINAGLPFSTPEAYFLGMKEAEITNWDGLSPDELKALPKTMPDPPVVSSSGDKELVIMVGFPGSGKSTFFRRYFEPKGYIHVNRDTLKTPEKCMKAVEVALQSGKPCVVDNTSPGKGDRAKYLAIAKKLGVPARCFVMKATMEMASHLNAVRMRLGGPRVSSIAYNMYKKNFEQPTTSEGFTEVSEVVPTADFTGMGEEMSKVFFELSG